VRDGDAKTVYATFDSRVAFTAPAKAGAYQTGEAMGSRTFVDLEEALKAVQTMPRRPAAAITVSGQGVGGGQGAR